MSSSFQKKSSSILATVFITLVILSFILTGYQTGVGNAPDSVASVDGHPIKIREFQTRLDQQIRFYSQITGGKNLTSKQIEQFGIKQNVLQTLINQKLMIIAGEELSIYPSSKEVADQIEELPYFKNATGQFDIQMYRDMLQRNGYTPSHFEDMITDDLKSQKTQAVFNSFSTSQGFARDIIKLKHNKLKAYAVELNLSKLYTTIPVSTAEIKEFLGDETQMHKVTSLFNARKAQLDQPEQVKARHILLRATAANENEVKKEIDSLHKKLTSNNFAKLANKYTQDPSGQNKGGDLGWFGRGQMAPEFENVAFSLKPGQISKPVKTQFGYHIIYVENKKAANVAKLQDYQSELATELIQKSKMDELKKVQLEILNKIEKLIEQDRFAEITSLQKVYPITFANGLEINRYDGAIGAMTLEGDQINTVFKQTHKVHIFKDAQSVKLVKTTTLPQEEKLSGDKLTKEIKKEVTSQNIVLTRKIQTEYTNNLKDQASIKINPGLM